MIKRTFYSLVALIIISSVMCSCIAYSESLDYIRPPILEASSAAQPNLPSSNNSSISVPSATPVVDKTEQLIEAKQAITIEGFCEFFVDYVNITNNVVPMNPVPYYTYYGAFPGRQYVDVCISFKNLNTMAISADKACTGTLTFADTYVYNWYSMIESDNRGDFTYSNITYIDPLNTEYIHLLFNVTDEMVNSSGEFFVILHLGNQSFRLPVREGTKGRVLEQDPNSSTVISGSLGLNDKVFIPDHCEFCLVNAQVVNDVIPPSPIDYYTHYEASPGKAYIDLCFEYKNWASQAQLADRQIQGKLIYDNKYNFNGFSIIEEQNRGSFTYTNITYIEPLFTEYLHYLFEVPIEVANSNDALVANITFSGNTYQYVLR